MRIALVNTNRMKPPIAPLGLEYIAQTLSHGQYACDILDLCWAEDWQSAVAAFFSNTHFSIVGITFRNTDDCAFTTRQSFVPALTAIVAAIRAHTDAKIVLGGVGFSAMPEWLLSHCRADFGIWGDGEPAFLELVRRLDKKLAIQAIPQLIWNKDGQWIRNAPRWNGLDLLPVMKRSLFDNPRYFREGGQIGIETKRGCSGRCIYCADPVSKGSRIRCRPARAVVGEMKNLLAQNIDIMHTCDSEFNLPLWHAEAVCTEILRNGLEDTIRWYAYCTPLSFTPKLALLMRNAGCAGINFGVDNGDDTMLNSLQRDFSVTDITRAVRACRDAGITTMCDLLLGGPGETRHSIVQTIALMKQLDPDRVGVNVGVRVYPCTELAEWIARGEFPCGVVAQNNPLEPVFFLEPGIAAQINDLLEDLIGDDTRFLFFNPQNPEKNYNYNENLVLVDAIQKGYRGAYWDILRKIQHKIAC